MSVKRFFALLVTQFCFRVGVYLKGGQESGLVSLLACNFVFSRLYILCKGTTASKRASPLAPLVAVGTLCFRCSVRDSARLLRCWSRFFKGWCQLCRSIIAYLFAVKHLSRHKPLRYLFHGVLDNKHFAVFFRLAEATQKNVPFRVASVGSLYTAKPCACFRWCSAFSFASAI